MNLIDQINQHQHTYVEELTEPDENLLRIVIAEAIVGDEPEDLDIGGTVLSGCKPIYSDESCCRYEVIFDHYVAYSVLNESYANGDPNDPQLGRAFRTYTSSMFLDYVSKATFATNLYPGQFKHYEIVCLDHVIDIASVNEPKITLLGPFVN